MKAIASKPAHNPIFLTVSFWVCWLIVLVMPVHAFVSTWLGTIIGPLWLFKSWKELLLGGLGLTGTIWLLSSAKRRQWLLGDRLLLLIGGYALMTLAVTAFNLRALPPDALLAGLAMNLRFPLIFAITYLAASRLRLDYQRTRHYVLHGMMWLGVILALAGMIQVFLLDRNFLTHFGYDKAATIAPYSMIDNNPAALRAFATLRGPNDYGAYLILPLLISLLLGMSQKRRYLVNAVVIAMAVFLSGSRSAWLGVLVAAMVMGLIVFGRRALRNKRVVASAIAGFVVGLGLVIAAATVPALRLAVFHSIPGDPSLTEGSTDNHWRAIADGLARVAVQPLGHGAGYAGPASYYGPTARISENYYVQLAEETGLAGLALFVAMFGTILHRLYRLRPDTLAIVLFSAGVGISFIGFWLHVWSDDPLSLTYFMLAGLVLGVAGRSNRLRSL